MTPATRCFKHVAQLMGDAVRTVDLCARYGGEEIAILLSADVAGRGGRAR